MRPTSLAEPRRHPPRKAPGNTVFARELKVMERNSEIAGWGRAMTELELGHGIVVIGASAGGPGRIKERPSRDQRREQIGMAGGEDSANGAGDQKRTTQQAAAFAEIFSGGCSKRGSVTRELAGEHRVENTGTRERIDKTQRVTCMIISTISDMGISFQQVNRNFRF